VLKTAENGRKLSKNQALGSLIIIRVLNFKVALAPGIIGIEAAVAWLTVGSVVVVR
jgi:hypothetical protein